VSRSSSVIATASVVGILGATTGCVHRSHQLTLGKEIPVPSGLDTTQTQAWIAQQEQRCPGRLMRLSDVTRPQVNWGVRRTHNQHVY